MMGDGLGMGYGGGFMWLFWLLVILALVWALILIAGSGKRSSSRRKSALEILQERYARGEIDRQEFEQKRKDLED